MDAPVTCLRITARSKRWPDALRHVEAAPEELWLRGRAELLGRTPALAIVGTRAPTAYGEAQALRFARAFVAAGAVVVSGLARGVDQAAHTAALELRGATIAVLGSGVDCPWPAGELADDIARRGLLLSEFAPGTGPRRYHFPQRNRILSGLCSAVVVIEASARSGSLITARWAVDQGRELFALPGRVDHPMARGCHRLLREGAHLVEAPEEVLQHLGLDAGPAAAVPGRSQAQGQAQGEPTAAAPDLPIQRALLGALTGETLAADQIAARLGRSVEEVLAELVQLELAGHTVRGPGGLYRLAAR